MTNTFGPAYNESIDGPRIARQMDIIRDYMLDSGWRTLAEIEEATRYPQASISAQIRHLRKPRFGGHIVNKQRRGNSGLWEYMVFVPARDMRQAEMEWETAQ